MHHGLLVAKLVCYGVGENLLKWLKVYLEGCELAVRCDCACPMPFRVKSGVHLVLALESLTDQYIV